MFSNCAFQRSKIFRLNSKEFFFFSFSYFIFSLVSIYNVWSHLFSFALYLFCVVCTWIADFFEEKKIELLKRILRRLFSLVCFWFFFVFSISFFYMAFQSTFLSFLFLLSSYCRLFLLYLNAWNMHMSFVSNFFLPRALQRRRRARKSLNFK